MSSLEMAYDNRFAGFLEHLVPLNGNTVATIFDAILNSYRHMGEARALLCSGAVLKNVDDSCIVCYEQWKRSTNFDSLTSTTLAPVEASLRAVAAIDLFMNDVSYDESRCNQSVTFRKGTPFYITVYSVHTSDDQQKFLAHIQRFMSNQFALANEMVAYTIHKSLSTDAVTNTKLVPRLAVVQQWSSLEAASKNATFWTETDEAAQGVCSVDYSGIYETIYIDQQDTWLF
ncbi:hypothetical protein O6H91_01G126500 [Diphasiastrum complanatum]|uniref:Uncharacterized protein n=1 Tax=Diphasiastrum complanatum TaxID=34168 RepID=A0ACC2EVS8_DIPCM|nr:hypothetical protein O6H91_01G126500 [Diphasiastrum complanatum]